MSPGAAIFRGLVLGYLKTNKLRSVVSLIAVALGVAIFVAVELSNRTAVASFESNVNVITNRVNLQVLGTGGGFDERVLPRVLRVGGVERAVPIIEDSIVIAAHRANSGSGEILRVLGVDLLQPLPEGVDLAGNNQSDPYGLLEGRGAIVSQRVLDRFNFHVGGTFEALANGTPVHLVVAAVVPRQIAAVDSSVVFVDIVTAQELFHKLGTLDRIDCIVEPGRLAAAKSQLAAILPSGTRVVEPETRTSEVRRLLRSFQVNLAAISLVALLVGAFLIYNTVAVAVVQRRADVGTLRALGATRLQIFFTFLAEGALLGVAGSLGGLALGALLAQFTVAAVSRTVSTLYIGTHVDRVVYDPAILGEALLFGILVAVLSAIAPAIEAAATRPAWSISSRGFEPSMDRSALVLSIVGALLLAIAAIAARGPAVGGLPVFGYTSAVCIVIGTSLFVPLGVIAVSKVLQTLGSRFSSAALLAAANFGATPRRNSIAVASLAIAVAMIVSVIVSVYSLRWTVSAWLDQTLTADLFVRPLGVSGTAYDARMSPAIPNRIAKLPGVAAVDTYRGVDVPFRGSLITLARASFRTIARRDWIEISSGMNAAQIARQLPGTTGVIVSAPLAERANLHPGDTVTLGTPSGRISFRIASIYDDYSNSAGTVIVDERTFARLYHDDSEAMFSIYARKGTDLNVLRSAAIRAALPTRIDVQTTGELRAGVFSIFDRTFTITHALNIIAVSIAVMGVVSMLFALILERRREIGVLRYLGLSTGAVRRMVICESALIGILGAAFGIGAGMLLGLLLIEVIDRQAFGWPMHLHVPAWPLAESLLLVIIAALLAGLYPAGVAARIATAEAVRSE